MSKEHLPVTVMHYCKILIDYIQAHLRKNI